MIGANKQLDNWTTKVGISVPLTDESVNDILNGSNGQLEATVGPIVHIAE